MTASDIDLGNASIEDIGPDGGLIDLSEVSLKDLDKLPPSWVADSLRIIMASNGVDVSAGFSSRI